MENLIAVNLKTGEKIDLKTAHLDTARHKVINAFDMSEKWAIRAKDKYVVFTESAKDEIMAVLDEQKLALIVSKNDSDPIYRKQVLIILENCIKLSTQLLSCDVISKALLESFFNDAAFLSPIAYQKRKHVSIEELNRFEEYYKNGVFISI